MRKADRYGGDCFDTEDPHADDLTKEMVQTVDPYFTYRYDEDCLYLNLWTTNLPHDHRGSETAGHGLDSWRRATSPTSACRADAGAQGSGFCQHELSRRRARLLGPSEVTAESPHHASGNYGILDLIAALEWTQRNISKFGGDPARVTILGESSGGMMVCFLMSSPLAQGLFQQAIMESLGCADTISPELKTPSHYEGGVGTAEKIGLRLMQ